MLNVSQLQFVIRTTLFCYQERLTIYFRLREASKKPVNRLL